MHKTRIYEVIWFPFRTEGKFIGPLLLCLLLLVGATGLIKSVDVFTSFISQTTVALNSRILVLILVLCIAVCLNAARTDYTSIFAALLPCVVTTMVLIAISAVIAIPNTGLTSALVQAAVSTFVTLGLVGRDVQSNGPDLGNVGAIRRRTARQAKRTLALDAGDSSFATLRKELLDDVQSLASALQAGCPDIVERASCHAAVKRLEEFLKRSARTEHDELKRDRTEGPDRPGRNPRDDQRSEVTDGRHSVLLRYA